MSKYNEFTHGLLALAGLAYLFLNFVLLLFSKVDKHPVETTRKLCSAAICVKVIYLNTPKFLNIEVKNIPNAIRLKEFFENLDTPTVSQDMQKVLEKEFTMAELYNTLKTCNDTAPGIDSIQYSIYKIFWAEIGEYLLDSWNFSLTKGELAEEHLSSVIMLLDKKDKDRKKLANLRPITLSNCDIKIFTKTLANRLKEVLPQIIHRTQTAYVAGRQVHDNLNFLNFCKEQAQNNAIDLGIISLDAKKAFDSVDHDYMWAFLKKYGFPKKFIEIVKMLYKNLKAKILINE